MVPCPLVLCLGRQDPGVIGSSKAELLVVVEVAEDSTEVVPTGDLVVVAAEALSLDVVEADKHLFDGVR